LASKVGECTCLPASAGASNKIKVFAWPWNFSDITIVTDAAHDLAQNEKLRKPADAATIYNC
jgi:hypothetical protein